MDNIEQLMIRACKSLKPSKRLKSIRKRFYLLDGMGSDENWNVNMLTDIVDKYCPIPMNEFMTRYESQILYNSMRKEKLNTKQIISIILINQVRLCKANILIKQGYKVPCKFRKGGKF